MKILKALRQFVSTVLMLCMLSVSVGARADVSDGMDLMWTQTNPSFGAANGNYGGQLGGISMRSPVRSFNVVAYDAPRFSAGCGGIDASFGSFSMMSIDNMRNIMRAIMANGTGYAAKIALDNLCTRCQGIMSGLHDMTAKINSASKNTCEIGSHVVDAAMGDTQLGSLWKGDSLSSKEAVTAAGQGAVADFFAANQKRFTQGKNANREGNAADKNTIYGNNIMNSLTSTGIFGNGASANAAIDTAPYGGDQGFLELAMNLYGTSINLTGANAASPASGGEFTKGSSQRSDKDFRALWGFDDLVKGAPTNASLNGYSCADFANGKADSCQNVAIKPSNWPGTRTYIINMLAGKQTGMGGNNPMGDTEISTIAQGSLMAYLADNSQPLNDKQRQFFAALPIETRTALSAAAATGNQRLMAQVVSYVADSLGQQMAAELIAAMNKTVNQAYASNAAGSKTVAALSNVQQEQAAKLEAVSAKYLSPEGRAVAQGNIAQMTKVLVILAGAPAGGR